MANAMLVSADQKACRTGALASHKKYHRGAVVSVPAFFPATGGASPMDASAHPGLASLGLLHRIHDGADRSQSPAGFGHLNLTGLRQRNDFSLWPQQRLDFQCG